MRALNLTTIVLTLAVFALAPAVADDETPSRKVTECVPAKDIIKFMSKFDKMKPERRDTVDAAMTAKFIITEGDRPERLYMKDGDTVTPLTIAENGDVPDFMTIKTGSKKAELCVDDPARAGMDRDKDGSEFEIDVEIKFKQAAGTHSLAEIIDGAGDGKSFYKKIVPGPVKLMIPKMTHVGITYDDPEILPDIRAFNGDTHLSDLIIEPYGRMNVISVEHLEELGTEQLRIAGGPYKMEPVPSIKKMNSLGFGDEGDEEGETKNDAE